MDEDYEDEDSSHSAGSLDSADSLAQHMRNLEANNFV
jgi:hypothetical protein